MIDVTTALRRLRTAIATDTHTLAAPEADRPMMLACCHWPGLPGLVGHSDGDVAAHAACDAVLQAGGIGDLGTIFGVGDPRWQEVSGATMLRHTAGLLAERGVTIINVAVQIIGNSPRIAPRRAEAEAAMSAALDAPVALSATTTDGLGFPGRGEGVAAVASALVLLPEGA